MKRETSEMNIKEYEQFHLFLEMKNPQLKTLFQQLSARKTQPYRLTEVPNPPGSQLSPGPTTPTTRLSPYPTTPIQLSPYPTTPTQLSPGPTTPTQLSPGPMRPAGATRTDFHDELNKKLSLTHTEDGQLPPEEKPDSAGDPDSVVSSSST